MKCVSYTRTLPWKNHQSELTIAEQNQRIAAYLAEHKELDLLKKYSDRKNDEKARTAFDQMTDDGVERKFDCIIVASMYYCGPDFPAARQAIKETLYATGIDLIVLDEVWTPEQPAEKKSRTILKQNAVRCTQKSCLRGEGNKARDSG